MEDLESGTIRNTAVKANRDGDNSVRMLDVEMSSPSDLQSVQLVSIGEDYHPLPGAKVMVVQVGNAWKMAIVLDDGLRPSAGEGERFIYSLTTAAALAAVIKLRNDSTMELNGDADFAVAFNDLKTAFNDLKADFNALVTLFGTMGPPPAGHVHSGVQPGSGSTGPPTTFPSQSTADIDPAKVATVKLP